MASRNCYELGRVVELCLLCIYFSVRGNVEEAPWWMKKYQRPHGPGKGITPTDGARWTRKEVKPGKWAR